jgi:lysophospholipase L1-like esterase
VFRGRFLSGLVTVTALAAFTAAGTLPAAGSSGTVQYVALGDSYAAGQGAGAESYLNDCKQSTKGYPALLDSEKHIHLQANETCTGATTSKVLDTQLSALNRGTRLVTLTVGGNDLKVSELAAICTQTRDNCGGEITKRLLQLSDLGPDLTHLYIQVASAAPKARIVVTGYPHLFEPVNPLLAALNNATDQLNTTIAEAVDAAAQATGADIAYVDVTQPHVTGTFEHHGIFGSEELFINDSGLDVFHPNAAGYVAYADAISAELDKQKQLV